MGMAFVELCALRSWFSLPNRIGFVKVWPLHVLGSANSNFGASLPIIKEILVSCSPL